jgi:diketogulonate reductase-like aldo/keto reductase
MLPDVDLLGVRVPTFLYGTAWKEEETAQLTRLALDAGFRGIDTANQRKHYHEAAVGEALAGRDRDQLFLQTKFTSRGGQDQRLPYDPRARLALQVAQSFQSSLEHLGVTRLDSYVLHGPLTRGPLTDGDWEIWRAMEALHHDGRTRLLGVSNVSLAQLEQLVAKASVPPALVQNRCYASLGWDREVRRFCRARGIGYQGFSLLTANREVLADRRITALASRLQRTVAQVVLRLALQLGMIALTGTSSVEHMKQDLAVDEFALSAADVATFETAFS